MATEKIRRIAGKTYKTYKGSGGSTQNKRFVETIKGNKRVRSIKQTPTSKKERVYDRMGQLNGATYQSRRVTTGGGKNRKLEGKSSTINSKELTHGDTGFSKRTSEKRTEDRGKKVVKTSVSRKK
jgi:hypothetical protein